MKRKLMTLATALAISATLSLQTSECVEGAGKEAPPLGRYNCTRVSDGSTLPALTLVSKEKYESADKTGIYVFEPRAGRIEWLTGSIQRELVGFYIPKGVDNAVQDTIIMRDKREVEEGNKRDVLRCTLSG